MKRVTFKNNQLTIVGNMYFPQDFDESLTYPAIVVGHPAGGVKEQTAGLYAERLAQLGYVTLAYDASYQGESEGQPRQLEDPHARVEDIRAAVDYFTTVPFIDNDRIGLVGICASGAYVIKAAQTDKRVKAVAGISASDIGQIFRYGWTGEQSINDTLNTLAQVSSERTAEANGQEMQTIGFVPEADEITDETPQEMKDGYEYYRTPRANHPRSNNKIPFISFDRIIEFTAFDLVSELLTQPLLVIAGSEAGTRWLTEQVYEKANEPKEVLYVEGANHFDMYDKEPYVTEAVEKMETFFKQYL
ncbi:alpha/beta hydrolase [Staphylococcus simiae]|uniref:alpha/beta hydrolase n=1 Tax=Staphylococcus simiae TaxID=308354 RepID=UPI001A970131|nr:alpha/beta hydrolase [Staphylococcus simiae]MBO1199234.1 alpha/beta hydrolase [Staphylococcus simiae]MBO1201434.1 alpha/beta hydrolase [Staphylococcus simiae]MBO1203597.1 alpha/beta hydrolase [Staphylococcus simiae]MBO1211205.1 alpha/beta hydrolase [Staphylococcus simiae]MBO1229831.1 alpha/beta hydrolase [Staphylococcus simiae]